MTSEKFKQTIADDFEKYIKDLAERKLIFLFLEDPNEFQGVSQTVYALNGKSFEGAGKYRDPIAAELAVKENVNYLKEVIKEILTDM